MRDRADALTINGAANEPPKGRGMPPLIAALFVR